MEAKEFKKILNEKTPNQILEKYWYGEIFLTLNQIDKVLKKRKGTAYEGHGGFNMKGREN